MKDKRLLYMVVLIVRILGKMFNEKFELEEYNYVFNNYRV